MSYAWSFNSFAPANLQSIFGGGDSDMEAEIVEAAMEEGLGEEALIERLAHILVQSKTPYAQLSVKEASALDELIAFLFTPEGLEEQLDVQPESPDFVHPSIIDELISRAAGRATLRLLPLLQSGRRLGESEPSDCAYCILSSAEVAQLQREVQQVMPLTVAWTEDYMPTVVQECLLDVLANVRDEQKALAAVLG